MVRRCCLGWASSLLEVTHVDDENVVRTVIETPPAGRVLARSAGGSARVKDRPLRRVKDLPASGQRVQL